MQKSKTVKNDEFYTLWQDIADELPLYREQLRGKRILQRGIQPCAEQRDVAGLPPSHDRLFVAKRRNSF